MPIQILKPEGFDVSSNFSLGGLDYKIQFRLNPADDSWKVSMFDSEGVRVISGMKCIPNQPLTDRYSRSVYKLPTGNLWCVDTGNTESNYVISDQFGADKRFQLWYYTESEEEELGLIRNI